MSSFAGRTFVLRIDEAAAFAEGTLIGDLTFMTNQAIHPIVVAPSSGAARALVGRINQRGNIAVGLSGADAAMIPSAGEGIGRVQTGILSTLTAAGYIPVIEPVAFSSIGTSERTVEPDDVARAVAAATDAVRAIFFSPESVTDPQTRTAIAELTPAEALALADQPDLPANLRMALRAAALGVRDGVAAAEIVDGRVAHAAIVEVLTAAHLGTRVTGSVFRGAA